MKRRRKASQTLDSIWPSHVKAYPDALEIGDQWVRLYTVAGWPREVRPGWLEPLLGYPGPLTLSVHSAPVDTSLAVKSMSRRMIWHRGSVDADRAQGRLGRADQLVALEDAEQVRRELAQGQTRMLEVGMTLAVWADTRELLEQNAKLLESLAQGMMLAIRPLRYQQMMGLRLILPLGELDETIREMDSRAWATLFPISSRDVIHPHGQVMGVNPISKSLVIADRFQLASPHSITIGWSGAGKSFAAKLEAVRSRYRGYSVSVVDPEGEYRWLGALGATVWDIGPHEGQVARFPYDPFSVTVDQAGEEVERQCDFLFRLLRRLQPDLMDEFGGMVEDSVWKCVRARAGKFSLDDKVSVTMPEVGRTLAKASRRAWERLELVWERWLRLAGSPQGELSTPFEVFNFSRLSDGMKGPVYLALTEWIIRRMGKESARRLVIFDEAWHLLTDERTASYLEELFRRARKWNTAISLVSQDIGDFVRSRAAEVCLRNAPMVLLMRQHPESIQEVARLLRLHEGEVQVIVQASPGEGLLLLGEDHVPVRIIASSREQSWLMGGGGALA